MRDEPPEQLESLLDRLGLKSAARSWRVRRYAQRLARDLPPFESVWVDALARTRVLTPFQAAEINGGRGQGLRIGPYAIIARLSWPEYAASYQARHLASGHLVHLVLARPPAGALDEILQRLRRLSDTTGRLASAHLATITEAGCERSCIWAASPWIEGRSAAEWVVHYGRFCVPAVLRIARSVIGSLVELDGVGVCHGDISAAGLVIRADGSTALLQPGLRAILRPEEGLAHSDLRPEAYDYLAPERVVEGAGPTTASDIYAYGCLLWHLLCGRPPLAGGNSLTKLQSVQAADVPDVRCLAPETPGQLADVLNDCLKRDPGQRPRSMGVLAARLGAVAFDSRGEPGFLEIASGPPLLGRGLFKARGSLGWRTSPAHGNTARYGVRTTKPAIYWPQVARRTHEPAGWSRGWLAVAGCVVVTFMFWWLGRSTVPTAEIHATDTRPVQPSNQPTDLNPQASLARAKPAAVEGPQDLILSADGPMRIDPTSLKPGQRVRGERGQRPTILVPCDGLPVMVENVRFENVDFLWDDTGRPQEQAARNGPCVVCMQAGQVEFQGCSFQATGVTHPPPSAILWNDAAANDPKELLLPSGRVQLDDCFVRGTDATLDCRRKGAIAMQISNTLHLGSGPLVRLDGCLKQDEPCMLALSHVTMRGAGPMLEYRYKTVEHPAGEIGIEACASVFSLDGEMPLIRFCGPVHPDRLQGSVHWTGQGSIVSPAALVAAWASVEGRRLPLDESQISISGLVRGEMDFAGRAEADPTASRLVGWQAPLSSADPPGIDARRLPKFTGRFDKLIP